MGQNYASGHRGIEAKKIEAGWLGQFFGMGDHALKNVMGVAVMILLLTIVVIAFCITITEKNEGLIKALTIIAPLFTLIVGYIAGAIGK